MTSIIKSIIVGKHGPGLGPGPATDCADDRRNPPCHYISIGSLWSMVGITSLIIINMYYHQGVRESERGPHGEGELGTRVYQVLVPVVDLGN